MKKLAMGIDIGGTNTAFGLVDEEGTVFCESVISTETLPYGSPIAYPGALTKESTAEYEYVFKGWDHTDQILQKNVTSTCF